MIGREGEIAIMEQLLTTDKSEMLAILGRRRIGKTYLIQQVYKDHMVFDFTGTQFGERHLQLQKFALKLTSETDANLPVQTPKTWFDAFEMLKTVTSNRKKKNKKPVIFFDELPWIDTHRSGFLKELSYWWNNWASKQNVVVVLCGSAASWMIKKIINHKGGLHNRVTQRINLQPFTLAETRSFLRYKKVIMTNNQILQLYMVTGGVPHYLDAVLPTETATQAIDRLCFTKDGLLQNEFNNLYAALYDHPENHIEVIKALATRQDGLTRNQISKISKLSAGGGLTKVLEELEASTFITSIYPLFNKKKDVLYRLTDEYSLFYLKYIEAQKIGAKNIWQQLSQKQSYISWSGYAFENICIKHAEAIKNALGIQGIYTENASYKHLKSDEESGFQIDLLIDRADQAINICEMKYYADELQVTQEMATKLRKRREAFRRVSKTKKMLFNTVITPYGLTPNKWSAEQIDHVVTADDLFELNKF
jgi:AAA+ ATPase superfamily predicted ATPase